MRFLFVDSKLFPPERLSDIRLPSDFASQTLPAAVRVVAYTSWLLPMPGDHQKIPTNTD
jgi:hypothetical protein